MEKHYPGKYQKQNGVWQIELNHVSLVLVPATMRHDNEEDVTLLQLFTEANAEYYELDDIAKAWLFLNDQTWKTFPVWMPDTKATTWLKADPIAQLQATPTRRTTGATGTMWAW